MKFAIVTADVNDIQPWILSLKQAEITYDVIDISVHNWMERCLAKDYDIYLLRAPGLTDLEKQMFDERVSILADQLGKIVYPSLQEILIYENKKNLSYWLKAHGIPSPVTEVFYIKKDALDYISQTQYPIVAKINIGASGKGVKIIKNAKEAARYINRAFGKGIRPYIGPNLRTASILTKLKNAAMKKGLVQKKLRAYKTVYKSPQKYVIFQEFVPHTYEWRTVVIGGSYFAHKKLVDGPMASGSLQKDYGNPPLKLLDFVRNISEKYQICSASMDIFETKDGFLINEIQTYFGQSDSFQMKVDGKVGRYRYLSDNWIFEPGDFSSNQCFDLRVGHILNLIRQQPSRTDK